ncbi:MAG: membrane protein insertase YidC, partial [Alphaproteobacteria bacterium]|nr:membrane protein insertase YidC [Alphaproteobacteria bacterium]
PPQTQSQPVAPSQPAPAPAAQPAAPATPGAAPAAPSVAAPGTPAGTAPSVAASPNREAALAQSPRISISTPSLSGSIALRGGRIDDLRLKNYKETIKADSANVTLLSPPGAPEPYYTETGFVSPDASLPLPRPDTLWTSTDRELAPGKPVVLTWDNGKGLVFKRTITVDDKFLFAVADSVENKSGNAVTLHPYALVHRVGKPKTEGFYVLHEGLLGIVGESKIQEITYDSIFKEKDNRRQLKGTGGWLGITDKYWATAIIPAQNIAFDGRFWGTQGSGAGATAIRPTYQTDVLGPAITVANDASAESTHRIFAGAKESKEIDAYQARHTIKNFDLMIDWGWFYFITKPLFYAIDFLYKYLGNFGFAILAITVIIKLFFFPLANKSYESMAKMKAVQPQMQELQKRYENDKQKLQQELMALYKREKINPIAGCWPILIQIPVFFALYKVIFITIEMRHAPFLGWIHDLSAQDPTNLFNLFGLLPFDPSQVPVLGAFLHMGIWPILMGITMFLQMKMNPEPTDPVQKAMFAWMPLIFTFMLASFPAGLVIYWTWNNILSILQQYYIMRKQGVKVELWDNLSNLFRKKPA